MSRIGKKPIELSDKTKVTFLENTLTVQGPKGVLTRTVPPCVLLDITPAVINVVSKSDSKQDRAFQGLFRSLINAMVIGVNAGFERVLEINGVGYKVELRGRSILFNLGFSHQVDFLLPKEVSAEIDRNLLKLTSIDKEILGQTAASIRQIRPPEPYKGKGVKYANEYIQRKAGKTGK